jgi:hypothetical protein
VVDAANGGRVKHALFTALALMASTGAHAQSFVEASVGAAWREVDDDPPFDQLELEYDTGTLARLEVGTQYDSGLQLRVGYTYTAYDEFTALGSLTIAEDIRHQDIRAGVFYATPRGTPLGVRVGGGYAYVDEEEDYGSDYRRGGFVEAVAVVEAGRRITLDFAAAFVRLSGPDYPANEIPELRAAAAFHTRALDWIVGTRYAWFDTEHLGNSEYRLGEKLLELRVGIAFAWRYPEGASY